MKKLTLLFAALLVFALAGTSCRKKEQPPVMPPKQEGMPGSSAAPHGPMGGGPEKKIVVPEDIKKTWTAVIIEVEFKEKKARKQFTIPVNSEFKVPDTDLTLKTGPFLPHFSMTADQITSASGDLSNPACKIEILVGGTQAFKGWLFARYPDIHSFEHDKYGVKLLGGVKK
jgi:hypothetical protein